VRDHIADLSFLNDTSKKYDNYGKSYEKDLKMKAKSDARKYRLNVKNDVKKNNHFAFPVFQ
jgi:hypothetical protein